MNIAGFISKGLSSAVCGVLLLGSAQPAFAASFAPSASDVDVTWAQTFDDPAVSAHVAAQGKEVVIISAGSPSKRLTEVANALRAELESSGTAGIVTLERASKRTAELSDTTLIERQGDASAERFVIVRVDAGDDARATISVYSSDADALGGFSAARGDTIEPPVETSHRGDTSLAVLDDDTIGETDDEALIEYMRKRVVFDGALQLTATGQGSAIMSRKFAPTTGAGAPLVDDEFYSYIGKEDLAAKFRRRRAAKVGLTSGGGVMAATGFVLMLALPLAAIVQEENTDCDADYDATQAEMTAADMCASNAEAIKKRKVRQGLGIGGALLGGGIVLTIVGGKMKAHSATAAQLQAMGEDYNRDLRKKLGVRETIGVRVSPSASRDGGGVVLSGWF